MGDYDERLAEVLTPCAPPEVIDGVYRDGEFERMLDVVRRRGPWPTIVSHHFQSVDELIATVVEVRGTGDDGEHLSRTISRRYADLVEQWVSSRDSEPT